MGEYLYTYNPNRSAEWNYGGQKWKLSRSKIDLFLECPRCFYLDNKLGTKRPGFPSFTLNLAVDELFKKEFDIHRKEKTIPPLLSENNILATPFSHTSLDQWRDNFMGVEYKDEVNGFTICGAVDDIWLKKDGTLIVADYKATSKEGTIESIKDSPWETQYKRQLGVYKWLLEKNGFTVDDIAYLVYANADRAPLEFGNTLTFETTLVPVTTETEWIEPTIRKIKETLDSDIIPTVGERCEFCPYREASGRKLLALHNKNRKKI